MLSVATLIAAVAAAGCSRFLAPKDGGASSVRLACELGKAAYLPGEAILCRITLRNQGAEPLELPVLDRSTVSFAFWPKGPGGDLEMRYAEPIASTKERIYSSSGETGVVAPGGKLERLFIFTTLSLERGEYRLQATYSRPDETTPGAELRAFAETVEFKVEGERVAAHRYSDGVLAKEDAIELAKREAAAPTRDAQAIMVYDEKGFLKWWVNLTLETPATTGTLAAAAPEPAPAPAAESAEGIALIPASDDPEIAALVANALKESSAALAPPAAPAAVVKSYFIDPYLARVWREAQPFTARDRQETSLDVPRDSKFAQTMRERRQLP